MDANQQAELQALAGRSLTSAEITLAGNRDDAGLAASLSFGLTQVVSKRIGAGSVLDALGAVSGAAFLDAMDSLSSTVSAIKWGLSLLNSGNFDVGSATSIGIVNTLVSGGTLGAVTIPANTISQATATALLNLAVVPLTISVDQVSNILNGA
ncbi:hypothetical protein [Paraburkholderia sp. J11-2]|uniref:hypothetical protein n=1 Tax=Paraburkholderia sp. J11-2 TaxID=2805431 RepID=UPI002AB7CF1E|nr:hypothetical protein [Paraburkholderia sp. J11-2]